MLNLSKQLNEMRSDVIAGRYLRAADTVLVLIHSIPDDARYSYVSETLRYMLRDLHRRRYVHFLDLLHSLLKYEAERSWVAEWDELIETEPSTSEKSILGNT